MYILSIFSAPIITALVVFVILYLRFKPGNNTLVYSMARLNTLHQKKHRDQ